MHEDRQVERDAGFELGVEARIADRGAVDVAADLGTGTVLPR
jgi:hypothetical protein